MINTTQKSATMAYLTIERLSNIAFSLQTSYKLFKVKKALLPHFEFQQEQEKALVRSCGADLKDGNWSFPTDDARSEFVQKLRELNELTIDVELEQEEIALTENVALCISDIEALSDFISFC